MTTSKAPAAVFGCEQKDDDGGTVRASLQSGLSDEHMNLAG